MFEITIGQIIFICTLIFFASFVDSIAGGGGIISIPAYLATGMPTHLALGSNKLSACSGTIFAVARYSKNGALAGKTALLSAASSFAGAAVGTHIALMIDGRTLKWILLLVLPLVAVFLLVKRDYGAENHADALKKGPAALLALLIGFLIGGYDGLFGPGTGTFAIIAYCTLMKYDLKTASGNAKALNLASNVASTITYLAAGDILLAAAIPAAVCGIAGGYIGSGLAVKRGARFIRPMMTLVIILLLGKLAFDLYMSVHP